MENQNKTQEGNNHNNHHHHDKNDECSSFIDKAKSKKILRFQKFVFIPIVSIKVIISFIFVQTYLAYAADYKIDTQYMRISVWLIVIIFFYSYYLSVKVKATQTNVDKFFKGSKEVQFFKQYFWNECQFCNNSKKFIRSSHCKTCQECILFRDHHCPFTANCIGFNNIQYFLNFLFWGSYAILYYEIIIVKFFLKKDNINLNDGSIMPSFIKILIYADFIINIFFFNAVVYLFFRTLLVTYENFTNMEKGRYPSIEKNFMCYNIYTEENKLKINNYWNIGFLIHFYYCIGPTLLNLFFPLPKFKNYCLDENCPILKKAKTPDGLQKLKILLEEKKIDTNSLLEELGSNPDQYIKSCHNYYDGKIII